MVVHSHASVAVLLAAAVLVADMAGAGAANCVDIAGIVGGGPSSFGKGTEQRWRQRAALAAVVLFVAATRRGERRWLSQRHEGAGR